jgi:hypothetical protein
LVSCYLLKPHTLCRHTFNVFICVSTPRFTWWDSIKWDLGLENWMDASWLRIETMGQFLRNGNNHPFKKKCRQIIVRANFRIRIHRLQACSLSFNLMLYLILNNSPFLNYEYISK